MKTMRLAQRGVALIAAIFLIVVLALLGLYMVSLTGVQQATTSQAISTARVYYGAKAGLDWGIYQAIAPTVSACSAPFNTTLAPITGLGGITVTVTCTCTFTSAANCNTSTNSVYYLTSTATFGTYGSANYAQRVLEATVTNQ
jgi:MSHA biogenesis protein MshP